ncbi:MAG: hypothetical protein NC417_12545 [Candidatus Gastranaerophilales bacterium]|nr:hypothetical protein [Candidatus Gastranaerophilales bacterium]
MRRIKSVLLCLLMSAVLVGCGETGEIAADADRDSVMADSEVSGSLSEGDFWRIEDTGKESVRFSTGLEVVYPENWQGNIVLREESDAVAFCEKGNADAGIGGDLFYLCLIERTEGTIVLPDWSKVFGLYRQGEREYVLVQDQPGDRCYSEDDQSLIDAYQALSETMDNVIIKTDHMQGFTECGIADIDWMQYESEWDDHEQSADDSAENQNDAETIFVNRHGDIFNGEGDTAGIMATLKAFEWLVPRSSGRRCLCRDTISDRVINGTQSNEAG